MASRQDRLRPPKVLIFDSYYATLGGNQRYIGMLLNADGWGWRPALCCPGDGDLTKAARESGAEVHIVRQSPRLDRGRSALKGAGFVDKLLTAFAILSYNIKLARALRRIGPDILQCHSTRNVVMTGLAAFLAGVPLVLFIKGEMNTPLLDRLALMLARTTIFLTDELRPPSRRAIKDKYPENSPTLPIGIPMHDVDAAEHRVVTTPPAGITRERHTVSFVFAGWLVETKGIHRLIEAFIDVHGNHPNTRLLIAGTSNDESYRRTLQGLVENSGVGDAVTFLGWRDDILDVIAASDVYVLPSFTEGVPRSIVEAMALGKPVIATTVGGIPSLLGQGEFGILCPPDDASSLASAMSRMVQDDRLGRDIGLAARKAARNRYTFQAHLVGLSDILRNSIKSIEKSNSSGETATVS